MRLAAAFLALAGLAHTTFHVCGDGDAADDTTSELAQMFVQVDGDGDGRLAHAELLRFFVETMEQPEVTAAEIDELLAASDADGDARLDLDEYLALTASFGGDDETIDATGADDADAPPLDPAAAAGEAEEAFARGAAAHAAGELPDAVGRARLSADETARLGTVMLCWSEWGSCTKF